MGARRKPTRRMCVSLTDDQIKVLLTVFVGKGLSAETRDECRLWNKMWRAVSEARTKEAK